jgi:hypothetical protein
MAGMLRVRRSRGAFSGFLLVLLGVWGGLVPLVGPYVHYAYTPDRTWTLTSGRIWLELLPAGVTVLGGLLLMITKLRPVALLGAVIAILSGAWFAVGRTVIPLWTTTDSGTPVGGQIARTMEQIGFFAGLGIVIICVGAVALGGLSIVSHRDKNFTGPARAGSGAVPAGTGVSPAGSGVLSRPADQADQAARPRRLWLPAQRPGDEASPDQADSKDEAKGTGSMRKVAVGSGGRSDSSAS